jgi:hypothetical protein
MVATIAARALFGDIIGHGSEAAAGSQKYLM